MASSIGPASPGRARLLVADDNEINLRLTVILLEQAGYAVDVARNGGEVLSAVGGGEYDAVLMDVQMPEVDGVEATQRIRALDGPKAAVPIIALTAHAMLGMREAYLSSGMDDYLSKPFNRETLCAVIRRWTAAHPAAASPCSAPSGCEDCAANDASVPRTAT